MSGIDKMKEKIKKKMTLDDLPTPPQDYKNRKQFAVHTDVHTDGNAENKEASLHQNTEMDSSLVQKFQLSSNQNPDDGESCAPGVVTETDEQQTVQSNARAGIQQHINTPVNRVVNTVDPVNKYEKTMVQTHPNSNTAVQQERRASGYTHYEKPSYGRKVTLYLTDELHKEFNDIYARRMLAGKKTDKSALICEAVQLLVDNEQRELL